MVALTKRRDCRSFPSKSVHDDIWIDNNTAEAYVYSNNNWVTIAYNVEEITKESSWTWKRNVVNINDQKWWGENTFGVFDWLLLHSIKWKWESPYELRLINLPAELKTMFTLRWK